MSLHYDYYDIMYIDFYHMQYKHVNIPCLPTRYLVFKIFGSEVMAVQRLVYYSTVIELLLSMDCQGKTQ